MTRRAAAVGTAWRRLRRLKLRTRITLAATFAVAIGIGAGVTFAYLVVRSELYGNIDRQLDRQVTNMQRMAHNANTNLEKIFSQRGPIIAPTKGGTLIGIKRFGDSVNYLQILRPSGPPQRPPDQTAALPVDARDLAVAAGTAPELRRTISFEGADVRLVTASLGNGYAVQEALPMTDAENQLGHVAAELLAAGLIGILLAAGLGWWVTRTALRPVGQLTEAAERVAATRDLAHRIDPGDRADRDELGRLAVSFNAMLSAVQDSTDRQRQLVADASHELRTPLTSLRTNVEVLGKIELLDQDDRERLIASVLAGIDDLTALVADTVELARGEEPVAAVELLSWDSLTAHVVERARLHWPGVEFAADLAPALLAGVPDRIQRAVANLLDNAAKFSGGAGRVEVTLAGDTLMVRDHGPGIPEGDLPHVFDRFYRAASMRDRPGSGLGLAIVAQVAESHGGSVSAANHPDGGAVLSLRLPGVRPADDDPAA
ncbi:MAG TPA: HAMP domain-containing sensor histidine kinase [Actinocrinis sp.]|uniref:HAMP domain-containing sensor histidine kinase n=1 Tax=Actinocrinis sp. TaxID=1920516 RepID=UPI002DDCFB6E|nr:HAMP domain-containing sensor histidine kinase [Actinocrinis sp.]HEV2345120.1 HAMP domain-containing sensor histidine kinase [Actinocrinis sp.]